MGQDPRLWLGEHFLAQRSMAGDGLAGLQKKGFFFPIQLLMQRLGKDRSVAELRLTRCRKGLELKIHPRSSGGELGRGPVNTEVTESLP